MNIGKKLFTPIIGKNAIEINIREVEILAVSKSDFKDILIFAQFFLS